MNMELDEMKQAWQSLDHRLEQQHALSLQMFRERKFDTARKALHPLWRGQVIQIAVGLVLMLQFAPYWVAHRHNLHLMAYGLMMHAYGLMCVLTAARNLHLQSRLDYAAPVIEIQRRLAALRTWRLREALLYGVTGCFIWIPLVLIGFDHVGADIWVTARLVVWADVASGVACLVLMYGIVRWSRLPGHERFRATLDNTIIGRSVRNTQAMLDEIARFERA
jgi:hypothetical protein